MQLSLKQTQLGLLNSATRIPFRYGKACLTRCPQAVLAATIETDRGRQEGYSGDCLPPSWFDKSPSRDYAMQIDDMLAVIQLAEKVFHEEFSGRAEFFPAWLAAYERVHSRAAEWQMPSLLASFGVSLVERAILDALCRSARIPFARGVRENLFGIVPGEVHRELRDTEPVDWLPAAPRNSIFVRHTVGLGDPLTAGEIPAAERQTDGFPQALSEYLEHSGLRYFKIKVSNQLPRDLERLRTIAAIIERARGGDYRVTLDGNEQYTTAAEFDALVDAIRGDAALRQFWDNVLAIEQPLERGVALDVDHTEGIRRLCVSKPVIIDESDGRLESYAEALEVGYRGVSSKNCKGPIKSILNAGLTWYRNERGALQKYLMTGEDLCTVGIIPVQSDLCLVAALGLEHVERNGHHYLPGLSHLPAAQQKAALRSHADLYTVQNGIVAPRLVDGGFQIRSLQCAGFGFAVPPELSAMQAPDQWQFSSLGLG